MKKSAKKNSAKKTPAKKAAGSRKTGLQDGMLVGWPTIAAYLGQPVAVAQRWGKSGMPVERKGRSMTAKAEELSQWLGKEAGAKAPVHIAQASDEDLLTDLRRGLKEARNKK